MKCIAARQSFLDDVRHLGSMKPCLGSLRPLSGDQIR